MSSPLMIYQNDPRYRRRSKYATGLMTKGSETTPVQHWTQALARVAQGITGGYLQKGFDDEIEEKYSADRDRMANALSKLGQPSDYAAPRPAQIVTDDAWTSEDDPSMAMGIQPPQPGQRDTRMAQYAQALGGSENPMLNQMAHSAMISDHQAQEAHRRALEVARAKSLIDLQNAGPLERAKQDAAYPYKVDLKRTPPRYVPVQNIGVYDTENDQYVGGATAPGQPAAAGPRPTWYKRKPPDPVSRMPPTQQAAAHARRFQTNLGQLQKDRDAIVPMATMAKSAQRFLELMKVQETGGGLRQIPGAGIAEGAIDPEIAEMRSLVDKITPAMRQGLPGAASDRDVAMFRGAAFGVDKLPQANRNIVMGFVTSKQNAEDMIAFKERYMAEDGRLAGWQSEWKRYLEDNPIFDPGSNPSNPQLNANRKTWQEYFGLLNIPSHGPTGVKVTEESIAGTMAEYNMTRTEVLKRLGAFE